MAVSLCDNRITPIIITDITGDVTYEYKFRILVLPPLEVVFVCMSVRYGFTIEIYGCTHSFRTFLPRAAHDAITRDGHIEVEDSENRSP